MNKFTLPDGRVFVSHSCWVVGDYGGAGSVGEANIRWLRDHDDLKKFHETGSMGSLYHDGKRLAWKNWYDRDPDSETKLLELIGDYGSRSMYVLESVCDELELLESMENYILFDDEVHSEVEMEWEQEAWDLYARDDLVKSIGRLAETASGLHKDKLYEAYRWAMEASNTYPETEYSGSSVDVDRVAPYFKRYLLPALWHKMCAATGKTLYPRLARANHNRRRQLCFQF